MKKYLSMAAIAAMCFCVFTACSDDDETPVPEPVPVPYTEGIYVVNSGSYYSGINGSLTFIGTDGTATQDVFASVNGRTLGGTPNDAVVYGDKLYIAVTDEHTLEVVDKNTWQSVKQLSIPEILAESGASQPRRLAADGGLVYVSTFEGVVAAIDTTTFEVVNEYQAGSYPEGIAVYGGKLYVANSDYGMGVNPSISIIDLATGESTTFTDALINNPTGIVATADALYVLDYGSYDANWNQTNAGVRRIVNGEVSIVADATLMAVDTQRGLIYTVNAPYTYPATPVTYGVYNMQTGDTTAFITGEGIDSPSAIAVDLVNGDVYIASYRISPDTGYADYSGDGYINQYAADGTFLKAYEAGVGPTAFAFSYGTMVQP